MVHESLELLERRHRISIAGDCPGGFKIEPTGKHCHGAVMGLQRLIQEVVAPVEGRLQRLMTCREIDRTTPEYLEARRSCANSAAGERTRTRAAASSIANGSPSNRRQIAAISSALSGVSEKCGSTALARSTNNSTASL